MCSKFGVVGTVAHIAFQRSSKYVLKVRRHIESVQRHADAHAIHRPSATVTLRLTMLCRPHEAHCRPIAQKNEKQYAAFALSMCDGKDALPACRCGHIDLAGVALRIMFRCQGETKSDNHSFCALISVLQVYTCRVCSTTTFSRLVVSAVVSLRYTWRESCCDQFLLFLTYACFHECVLTFSGHRMLVACQDFKVKGGHTSASSMCSCRST